MNIASTEFWDFISASERYSCPVISVPSNIMEDIPALFKHRVKALKKMSHSCAEEPRNAFKLAKVDIVVVSDMNQRFGYVTLV